MYKLIIDTAQNDERVRAIILNGSRANPNATCDIFQDYDVVYIVTDVESFEYNIDWLKYFGEIMIMQMPNNMLDPAPSNDGSFAYLMQFTDGNRLDLTLYPLAKLSELKRDSLSVLLLDKDGIIKEFGPSSERDYLPKLPSNKQFADCCNEFWWVSTYVAKGLWREEIIYAKYMFDQVVRQELLKMLTWYISIKTDFSRNLGKVGKHFKQYLEPQLWNMLEETYSDVNYDKNWDALLIMCDLFRITALCVAKYFGFDYPYNDDQKVTAHLKHVRLLPKNAKQIY